MEPVERIEEPPAVAIEVEDAVQITGETESETHAKVEVNHPLKGHVLIGMYTLVGYPAYGEVLVGPSFMTKHLLLNAAVGIETADMPLRCALALTWEDERVFAYGRVEHGGSGPSYMGQMTFDAGPVRLGAKAQRYDGVGPFIGFDLGPVRIWTVAPMYDFESRDLNVLSGITWEIE